MLCKHPLWLLGLALITLRCLAGPVAFEFHRLDAKTGALPTEWWQPLTPPDQCSIHLGMAVTFTKRGLIEYDFYVDRGNTAEGNAAPFSNLMTRTATFTSDHEALQFIFSDKLKNPINDYLLNSETIAREAQTKNIQVYDYTAQLLETPCIKIVAVLLDDSALSNFLPSPQWTSTRLDTFMLISGSEVIWHNALDPDNYKLISPAQLSGSSVQNLYFLSQIYAATSTDQPTQCNINYAKEFGSMAISCHRQDLYTIDGEELCWQTEHSLYKHCTNPGTSAQIIAFQKGVLSARDDDSKHEEWSWEQPQDSHLINLVHTPGTGQQNIAIRKPFSMLDGGWKAAKKILSNEHQAAESTQDD